ncbi:MAG TPA: response regulator [Candidatus Aerophobetes bacterium]|uniref:Response regulator n=1 Tax=Aerophobetes bacterium TaxID=2030807 RepID=A0A7V0N079_UNCAE|nr:response regulator [Candidatus Aerophobetes bacterium]
MRKTKVRKKASKEDQYSGAILVVDDEPANVDLVQSYLKANSYKVIKAYSGEEALKKAFADPPDLILLDVMMPDISGFEICRRLKSDNRTQLIPVILLTALQDFQSKIQGLEAGADEFLSKPFNLTELLTRVRNLLRIKRLTDQLEQTESVIFALARAVEAKDSYTKEHILRIANYAERLGRALNLESQEILAIRYGGILHDIGKIGVSEAILRKPGPLTEQEWLEIRKHPIIGESIIQPMRFANKVGPIVRGHHERWDGKGYPDGLKEKAIPLGARIVALVDSYDAMTTDRPYRKALSVKRACREIEQDAGSKFDPELVPIFLKLLKEGALLS